MVQRKDLVYLTCGNDNDYKNGIIFLKTLLVITKTRNDLQ